MTLKEQIEKAIEDNDINEAKDLLKKHEEQYPFDLDNFILHMNIALNQGDIASAFSYAKTALRKAPVDGDSYYNIAYIYELMGNNLLAYYNYSKALWLYHETADSKEFDLNVSDNIDNMLIEIENSLSDINTDVEKLKKEKYLIDSIQQMERNAYGFSENAFRSYEQIIGKYMQISLNNRRYIGLLNDQFARNYSKAKGVKRGLNNDMDLIHMRGEFLEVLEGNHIVINNDMYDDNQELLIPIACDNFNTVHAFIKNGEEKVITQYDDMSFCYYRIKNNTEIQSSGNSYYGKPIPLLSSKTRKRLVMSIFVDGLAGEAIQGNDFAERMPNTYDFFKTGTICDNAYACGEWTFPSIANIVSGLYTPNHMMFHNTIDMALPYEIPTLDEYYHDEGYYTAKLNGNWRIIPTYGYTRGVDRYVYQHAKSGYKVEDVIGDAIDHLKAFDETDTA